MTLRGRASRMVGSRCTSINEGRGAAMLERLERWRTRFSRYPLAARRVQGIFILVAGPRWPSPARLYHGSPEWPPGPARRRL